jgi:hypothetical protein
MRIAGAEVRGPVRDASRRRAVGECPIGGAVRCGVIVRCT